LFQEFTDTAKELVERMRYKYAQLDQEEEKLRKRLNEIESERAKSSEINTCIDAYTSCGCDYPCPECFVSERRIVEMISLDSDDELDIFKCKHCNLEIEIES